MGNAWREEVARQYTSQNELSQDVAKQRADYAELRNTKSIITATREEVLDLAQSLARVERELSTWQKEVGTDARNVAKQASARTREECLQAGARTREECLAAMENLRRELEVWQVRF